MHNVYYIYDTSYISSISDLSPLSDRYWIFPLDKHYRNFVGYVGYVCYVIRI
jgi:hypothetical protein